ncbi:F-box/kelch-repeat protein SKIP25 [Ricinus communis]|uniref:Protein AFR n=1 Tax=Ricinus communis TaxID=3988 RepID=B9T0X9_RICCO|nr:F-box/kelch-repeat protein SKIP25 [Ricinus communis]EEF30497.1 conserved hypothetical protein [Ricinus communis]|eukprot:XP_002531898.1 F-box/kelch-repeat protein SKIP25 [Ricinus communis]
MANPVQAETTARNTAKRQRLTRLHQQQPDLIPGLPDHVAQLCLSLVPPSLLYSVCHSWRRLIYSPAFPPFLSLYAVLSSINTDRYGDCSNSIKFFNFDPISSTWDLLPPPPPDPPLRPIIRHPSFISRHLPIQSVTVSGHLILLAATTDNFYPALSRPFIFNPVSRRWSFGPPLTTPRRWCAAGAINNSTVYVASGIGSQFSADIAKSVEKWEFLRDEKRTRSSNQSCLWKWEKVKGLKDGRFSRDAIDAIGWRGKLCMVNVKGDAAKEGLVYDTKKDLWEDMPIGMLAGWKGPVAAMDEEVMYVVDEVKGALRKYDPSKDVWENIITESENFKGAQQIAAAGGRVCVVCEGGNGIAVVDVVAAPVRLWTMDTPPGFEAVAVHILPRMSKPELGFPVPP